MTATDLKSAIETYERTLAWMLVNDRTYVEVTGMMTLIAKLRSDLLTTQRGTFAVGGKGAR